MDSLTDGTASLLRYDDRRRQLDLLCVIGVHSSSRYAGNDKGPSGMTFSLGTAKYCSPPRAPIIHATTEFVTDYA